MPPSVIRTPVIQHRVLTILVLGVLTSALSLFALVQLFQTSMAQRVERARDSVTDEVDRLARDPGAVGETPVSTFVGMRGGVFREGNRLDGVPSDWGEPIARAARSSRASQARAIEQTVLPVGTLVVAARRTDADPELSSWSAYLVRPSASLRNWRVIVVLLAILTALLVGTAVYSVVTLNGGAAALRASLAGLAEDLSTPVPRPNVRELADIASGIANLAQNLMQARKEEARLAVELSRRDRLAALGRVVAGVAHEVRNPLASIKLRLDLATQGAPELPVTVEKAIAHASSEIARLDRLVQDLLVIAGRAAGPRATTSLAQLVERRVEAMAAWAEGHGVDVVAVTRGDATARVEEDAIARAVDNLLRNAIEASSRGQRVEVRVDAEDGLARVQVDDSGNGVEIERVAELFEPFFTTKSEGTGLGLAISRAIARAHNGDVTYARRGGRTMFELTVARSESPRAGSPPRGPAS